MPRIIELTHTRVAVDRGTQIDPETGEPCNVWTIVYQDQISGDLTRFTFPEPIRDYIVKGLMGGIVIAAGNGDTPTPAV